MLYFFQILSPKACGFSFPSFENITTNEALEHIREAGKQIIEKASRQVETIRETVQKKKESLQELEPTEKMRGMLREFKERAGEQQKTWEEHKGKMKEIWKEMEQKAGEQKEELKKKWKENTEILRSQTEEVSMQPCDPLNICFTALYDWSKKLAPLTQPIRCVFPRLAPATCICFEEFRGFIGSLRCFRILTTQARAIQCEI